MVVLVFGGGEKIVYLLCFFFVLLGLEGLVFNLFLFYFEKGESDNLFIYFNGGGVCWDSVICLVLM